MNVDIIEFAERIKKAENLDDSLSILQQALSQLGFIHVKYGWALLSKKEYKHNNAIIVGNFSDEWEEYQSKQGNWSENDYFVEHYIQNDNPVTYSQVYAKIDNKTLTQEQIKNHDVGREMGMAHGIAFPIKDLNPLAIGGISMEASRSFTENEFANHLSHHLSTLRHLCDIFHANINKSYLIDKSEYLSPRERECLTWVICGLRLQEIAFRMGTHPKTVEKQLANARRKLNAKTNAQAAIRALTFNLLTP
ncbi:MAG: LuxR family transcriptional regulator [Sneathiellales bacterium]|nr:LuxR family transcriptional regulator [Sneathiellales bacterium]